MLRLLQFSLAVDLQQRASRAQGGSTASLVLTGMLFRTKARELLGKMKEQRACLIARYSARIPFPVREAIIGWLFKFK